MTTPPTGKSLLGVETDQEWLEILARSVREPVIAGVHMPRWPLAAVQENFVGSADELSLQEAGAFFRAVKAYAERLANPLRATSSVLDFGTGWGRYPRLLWGDVAAENIHGVDVDGDILATCRHLGVPGRFSQIAPRGSLPFEAESFDLVIAYSVFSHLPEDVARHWMAELRRVARPGCILAYTTEPRRFLTFVQDLPAQPQTAWHALLGRFRDQVPEALAAFDRGEFVFLPTSGGDHLDASIYGDAVVPPSYIEREWCEGFRLVRYLDDPAQFWQALVVAQRL
ncbi:class I SAM-dependent methyltransferase [Roseococcus sp. DSY-14]|uniref:class I SAM-dependent methyltransferase n=1 Tax=Roseococcus sp. DSY-14 TaxID=3369650 RepID=UPI00387AB2D6